ncbi:hypothetical protein [Gordonia paraffinivorans]|uniref:hypothetical protein n=1 Tax=Gordonia paraffinivorans TaxID=175628 RepID=UPI0014459E22|nr:hypothetical protein [Gordonia paraffinivorans]
MSVTVHSDGRVDLRGDDVRLTLWTHDPDELDFPRGVLDRAHWISKYSVLIVNGRMFNLGSPDARSACQYAEPAEAIERL